MKKQNIKLIVFAILTLLFHAENAQTSAGFLNSNATVCSGNNNGIITLTGYSGSIVRWEFSNSPNGPWSVMMHTSNSYSFVNLVQSTYFRAVVQMTGYPESASNSVYITCNAPTIPGTAIAATLQCTSLLGTASVTGQTGTIPAWQISSDNWITSSNFGAPNSTLVTLPAITTSAAVRAVIKNGACPSAFSNTLNILAVPPSTGGSVNGNTAVCSGTNSFTLALNGYAGLLQQWESSLNSSGPFSGVANSATSTILFGNQIPNTYYRARVQSGNCPVAYSNTFLVNADMPSLGGYIIGTNSVCSGINTVSLQLNASTGTVTQWEYSTNNGSSWQFINITTGSLTLTNISASRTIRARVQNGVCPAVNSASFAIFAYPTPSASFIAANVCKNAVSGFTNVSTGATSYVWDFGDGNGSPNSNPSHIYYTSGNYFVRLKASSNMGCIDSTASNVISYPLPSPSILGQDSVCTGNSIVFSDNSTISSGTINSVFDYADGSPTSTISPWNHTYLQAGIFQTKLLVTSNFGCRDSILRIVRIFPKPIALFATKNNCVGNKVNLTNNSSIIAGQILHHWSFGNGDTSAAALPQYTYNFAGTYSCALITRSDNNCSDTIIVPITINPKIQPSLSFPANNCHGLAVQFTTASSNQVPILTATLFYGDGDSAVATNFNHNYAYPGVYFTRLVMISDSGCASEIRKSVTVFPAPQSGFNVSGICRNDTAYFQNLSTYNAASCTFKWVFSDSSIHTGQSPRHQFTKAGFHKTNLIITTDKGCMDSTEKIHQVYERPLAGFMAANVCQYASQTFTNTSVTNNALLKYVWSFGDGTASMEKFPNKSFDVPGHFKVNLISTNTDGCSDTASQNLQIYETLKADFSTSDICLNEKAIFTNHSKTSTAPYDSQWTFGDGSTVNKNSPDHNFKHAGKYTVKLLVSGFNLCADSLEKEILVHGLPKVSAITDSLVDKGSTCRLRASGALSYSWFPETGISDPFSDNTICTPTISNTYIVGGQNEYGCFNVDSVFVNVKVSYKIIPFNILTPDNNGKNDTWIIGNIEAYPDNSVSIYSQWNEMVYTRQGYKSEWNGTNMRGEILPEGTYYYLISFPDSSKIYSGYITLMRQSQ